MGGRGEPGSVRVLAAAFRRQLSHILDESAAAGAETYLSDPTEEVLDLVLERASLVGDPARPRPPRFQIYYFAGQEGLLPAYLAGPLARAMANSLPQTQPASPSLHHSSRRQPLLSTQGVPICIASDRGSILAWGASTVGYWIRACSATDRGHLRIIQRYRSLVRSLDSHQIPAKAGGLLNLYGIRGARASFLD